MARDHSRTHKGFQTFIKNGRLFYDLKDERFGKLTVAHCIGKVKNAYRWYCRCDCGGECYAKTSALVAGHTKSCGCSRRGATAAARSRKHGLCFIPEYGIWLGMRGRCNNPNLKCYKDYGGRGIKVFAGWDCPEGFPCFFAHVGSRPTPRHMLDRIDNERGYEPGNVRWTVRKIQNENRRVTRWIVFRGERRTCAQWAKHFGMKPSTLWSRLYLSRWSFAKSISTPVAPNRHFVEYKGKVLSLSGWEREIGISQHLLRVRLVVLKWPVEKAMTTPFNRSNQ